jgi:FADH2 O2-dependent halogenase
MTGEMMRTKNEIGMENDFDIAILGAGIGGSVLACTLVQQGMKVLLIDNGTHPRFAIGESMVPRSSQMLRIIGQRYNLPEVTNCSSFYTLRKHVAASCGIKKNFGFVYHRWDEKHRLHEANQAPIPKFPHGWEAHIFRQDVDAYLSYTAVKYGVTLRQQTDITDVSVDENCVTLKTKSGQEFKAKYVVDAGGFRSPFAEKFQLREKPNKRRTHSWSLFTHMVGVKPFEECLEKGQSHGMPERWSQGTLHHIFDGGWMWVIPFDNHDGAANPVCSVGLSLDPRKFPRDENLTPEQEFYKHISRLPSLEPQFRNAKVVRPWVATGRLQYNSTQHAGDRFFLLAHAGGNIDALHSRGMANTFYMINALAERLPQAMRDNDFSFEYFRDLAETQNSIIDYNDRLVNASYNSFMDFELWNAWSRIWTLGVTVDALRLNRLATKYTTTGDISYLNGIYKAKFPGSLAPDCDEYEYIFNAGTELVDAAVRGDKTAAQATDEIYKLLANAKIAPPNFYMAKKERRYRLSNSLWSVLHFMVWGKITAPKEIRKKYFDFGPKTFFKAMFSVMREEASYRP